MENLQRFCRDDETGEITAYNVNEETGEQCLHSPILCTPLNKSENRKVIKFPKGYITKSRKFQELKANILAGSNMTSYRMLLIIPTFMIFSSIASIFLIILEIFLHVRCHKKNKKLQDQNIYYRSPFHVITSTFCGVCRDMDMACKIGQLQDKRRYHYDYLRQIAM